MKHWNFFPSLFALLAFFWWGHVELTKQQMELDMFRPKIEIKMPKIDDNLNFGVPPIPPLNLPETFDPHGPNSADGNKSNQSKGLPKTS